MARRTVAPSSARRWVSHPVGAASRWLRPPRMAVDPSGSAPWSPISETAYCLRSVAIYGKSMISSRPLPPPFSGRSAVAAMLGIVGGVLLSRAFLRRVDAISRTEEAIIGGDLTRRVPTHGTGDDLDRLAGTLNHLLDRIGILMEACAR
jgi:HAMP domain-containing protein